MKKQNWTRYVAMGVALLMAIVMICRRSGRFSPRPGTFPASGARRYSPTAWTGRTGITF